MNQTAVVEASAQEIKDFVSTAEKKQGRAKYETVFVSGIPIAEAALFKVAVERKQQAHYSHKHEDGYAKLEQVYKCRVCQKEVEYADRSRVIVSGKQDSENPVFQGAEPKPEKEEGESGIHVEGETNALTMPHEVKEVFYIAPKRFKAKKDKARDTANINAIGTLCEKTYKVRFHGRVAIIKGRELFVLWNPEEQQMPPRFPEYQKSEAVAKTTLLLSPVAQYV